jgi:hypothetical protein
MLIAIIQPEKGLPVSRSKANHGRRLRASYVISIVRMAVTQTYGHPPDVPTIAPERIAINISGRISTGYPQDDFRKVCVPLGLGIGIPRRVGQPFGSGSWPPHQVAEPSANPFSQLARSRRGRPVFVGSGLIGQCRQTDGDATSGSSSSTALGPSLGANDCRSLRNCSASWSSSSGSQGCRLQTQHSFEAGGEVAHS